MFSRLWSVLLLAILVIVNITLFMSWRNGGTSLSSAQLLLVKSDGVDSRIEEGKYTMYYVRDVMQNKGEPLTLASGQLKEKIDSLARLALVPESSKQDPDAYFTQPVVIPPSLRESILKAHARYDEALTAVLQTELSESTEKYGVWLEAARSQLIELHVRAAATPDNHIESAPFRFYFRGDSEFKVNITWAKKGDSVEWRNLYLCENYVSRLQEKMSKVHALQTQRLLNKLAKTFETPGKLTVYGESYSLEKVTRAELASACKYLSLLQMETEEHLREAIQNISQW